MRTTPFVSSAFLLTLCSCTLGTWIVGEAEPQRAAAAKPFYDYSVFYRASDNPWVGRSRDELIEALGPPEFVYEARPRFSNDWADGFPAYTYVYRGDTNSPGRCIDAYVVAEPTSTVIKYYCR